MQAFYNAIHTAEPSNAAIMLMLTSPPTVTPAFFVVVAAGPLVVEEPELEVEFAPPPSVTVSLRPPVLCVIGVAAWLTNNA